MRSLIRFCPSCNDYTLDESCHRCGARTRNPVPARYSPEDRYGPYRRKLIKEGDHSHGQDHHRNH